MTIDKKARKLVTLRKSEKYTYRSALFLTEARHPMDIQELRQSLKMKWLSYYEQNRSWLVKMKVWATYGGLRRPSSGFILATLSVLEPQFEQTLAFIMELNTNPDEIVAALGLNFNPDAELRFTKSSTNPEKQQTESKPTELSEFALKDTYQHQHWESQPVLSLVHKPMTQEVDDTPQLEPAMLISGNGQKAISYMTSTVNAVSTHGNQINSQPVRLSATDHRSSSVIEVSQQTRPLPSLRLALATEPHRNGKAVRLLEITTKVPSQPKTLPTSTLGTEMTQNGQYLNKRTPAPSDKFKPLPSTNATSLASWVDEFCQGTGYHQDETISIFR